MNQQVCKVNVAHRFIKDFFKVVIPNYLRSRYSMSLIKAKLYATLKLLNLYSNCCVRTSFVVSLSHIFS